ncbi:MAG: HD domain-containing phosphohydrolase [Anaerolineae bacterium]
MRSSPTAGRAAGLGKQHCPRLAGQLYERWDGKGAPKGLKVKPLLRRCWW